VFAVDALVTSEIKSCVSLFVKLPLYVSVSFWVVCGYLICLYICQKCGFLCQSGK